MMGNIMMILMRYLAMRFAGDLGSWPCCFCVVLKRCICTAGENVYGEIGRWIGMSPGEA
jgi:hypothetical protein